MSEHGVRGLLERRRDAHVRRKFNDASTPEEQNQVVDSARFEREISDEELEKVAGGLASPLPPKAPISLESRHDGREDVFGERSASR